MAYGPHQQSLLNIYYHHPDHLGSSSYITNSGGVVCQHMEYLPFGETLIDEHLNSNNSPFKFNGKEFDEETGNYYYSARYYDPKLSIFISIDPLADKYPSWSSYAYTFNNPIKYIDPTGMEGEVNDWLPTNFGNFISQDGDNAETLSKSLNKTVAEAQAMIDAQGLKKDADGNVLAGQKISVNTNYSRALTKSAKAQGVTSAEIQDENLSMGQTYGRSNKELGQYNCTSAAIMGTMGIEINQENAKKYSVSDLTFSRMLKNDYEKVSQKDAIPGKTIYHFNTDGTHAAVYYNTSKNGTIFLFTKNGDWAKPEIMSLQEVEAIYGPAAGIYNKK